jgi:RimJ/RimL family protein N-acetyltransferase
MIIQFENIRIREFQLADLKSLVKYANNYNISKYMRDSFPYPYTENTALNWIEFTKANNSTLSYAIANKIEVIGGIGATPQNDVHRFAE